MNTTAVDAFTSEGFNVLRGLFSSDDIAHLRQLRHDAVQDWCFANGTAAPPIVVGDLLERYPRTILKVVADPDILGLAEAIMGPFVQLDSAVLHASPVRPRAERGGVVCWHRDRFGSFPVGAYTRPLTLVCFIYLQEMNDDTGPLRVVPRSHRDPVQIPESDVTTPHADEVLITTSPGDVVVIHNNLLHSGTANVSDAERQFLGISYT
ncbi:MAG: phytanoyl-CoA dioxygenase family protein, partial [Haloechinothrix sp.]